MEGKYLPLGTVVLLKDAEKRIMITGFCSIDQGNDKKMYDYCGCLYPEGSISSKQVLLFDHNQIDKIYYMGYRDNEEIEFKKNLVNLVTKLNNQGQQ